MCIRDSQNTKDSHRKERIIYLFSRRQRILTVRPSILGPHFQESVHSGTPFPGKCPFWDPVSRKVPILGPHFQEMDTFPGIIFQNTKDSHSKEKINNLFSRIQRIHTVMRKQLIFFPEYKGFTQQGENNYFIFQKTKDSHSKK